MKLSTLWSLLKNTYTQWNDDKAFRLAAALAFYSTFSIAPLLIIVIAIAALVFGDDAARGAVVAEFSTTIGPQAAKALESMVNSANDEDGGVLAMVIGIVILVLGASGVFVELQDALNTIWKAPPRPGRAWLDFLRIRFLSFSLVLGLGFLLLASLLISAALSALAAFLSPAALPGSTYLWELVNGAVSFAAFTVLFASTFKLLPDVKVPWRGVWVGAAVTALLFIGGKHLIGLYLGQSSVASAYGAAGTLVVLLLWVYYSALLVLFGAEFTRAYSEKFFPAPVSEQTPHRA